MKVEIIADLGSSHRGQLDLALKGIECAKRCGADVAKFQLFTHEELYGIPGEMPFALPADWLPKLAEHAAAVGIEFMCTAFSDAGVRSVDPFVLRHKLASSEFCHVGIIDAMIATGKPIIASTGGMSHGDVEAFLKHYTGEGYYQDDESGYRKPLPPITLLECVALYPSPPELYDVTWLRRMEPDSAYPFFQYGLSDHTIGCAMACAAVGAGAVLVEKHLDPWLMEMPATPDSAVSLGPAEFAIYVQQVREAASAVGDGIKQPRQQHEMQTHWRRRLIATQVIEPGQSLLYGTNFGIYRSLKPDTKGLPPRAFAHVEHKKAKVRLEPGDSIGPKDLEE